MLFAFLALGSLWFWAALLLPFLILIWAVECEKAGAALATVLLTIAAFVAFGDPTVLALFKDPMKIAIGVGGYIIGGVTWGFMKWFFYVLRARDRYEAVRAQFLKEAPTLRYNLVREQVERDIQKGKGRGHSSYPTPAEIEEAMKAAKVPEAPEGFDKELFKEYARRTGVNLEGFPPRAGENKGRILFWMSYWPASAFWTVLNDPLRHVWNFIYRRLGVVFENISQSMFGRYKDELA